MISRGINIASTISIPTGAAGKKIFSYIKVWSSTKENSDDRYNLCYQERNHLGKPQYRKSGMS
jgi:hypothetical protein